MNSSKDITITYETLFEILKKERDVADLQKLDPSFYTYFVQYFQDKLKVLEKEDSIFSYEERKKAEKQIENARRIIKELYDRREKKIINFAIIKSRTKVNIMDISTFLEEEKQLFEDIASVLGAFRDHVANNLIVGRQPELPHKTLQLDADHTQGKDFLEEARDTKLVRFLYSVPKFVGTELEEYGPFEEEDIANLPMVIADLLIGKGKVEEIKG